MCSTTELHPSPFSFYFETGSHSVSQAWSLQSSSLSLPRCWITGMATVPGLGWTFHDTALQRRFLIAFYLTVPIWHGSSKSPARPGPPSSLMGPGSLRELMSTAWQTQPERSVDHGRPRPQAAEGPAGRDDKRSQ